MADEVDYPKDLLLAAAVSRNCPFGLPHPLNVYLDELLTRARGAGAGMRTSRSELVAALLLAAPRDGNELKMLLDRYRVAAVGDLEFGQPSGSVVRLPVRQRPGPR